MRVSRRRVVFQVLLHLVLIGHVLAYYFLDWTAVGGLDFQDFFYNLLGQGVITAAVLFAGVIYLASLFWGRLFCSWGCHFGATQDLAAWILRKVGWKPPVIHTRFLHWLPFVLLIVIFGWPVASRWISDGWEFRGVPSGGAFSGDGPWERLPGWFLSTLTFLVCGGGILLFLGTRGFCRFVCPYGAVFRLTDRVAPFRVRRTGDCRAPCSTDATPPCTSACPTAIDVHTETSDQGSISSLDCVRCHLCIEACPSNALSLSLATPETKSRAARSADSKSATRRRAPYSLSLLEESVALLTVVVTYVVCDLVYGGHFLAATWALAEAFVLVHVLRLLRSQDVRILSVPLRLGGEWRLAGISALAIGFATLIPLAHAGAYKWHRHAGFSAFERKRAELGDEDLRALRTLELRAQNREETLRAARHLRLALHRFPSDLECRQALCIAYTQLRDERALVEAKLIVTRTGESIESLEALRRVLIQFGRMREAEFIEAKIRERSGAR